jgi:hypothetical protein
MFHFILGLMFHFILGLMFHFILGLMLHFVFRLMLHFVFRQVVRLGCSRRNLVWLGVLALIVPLGVRLLTAAMALLPVVVSRLLPRLHFRLGGRAIVESLMMVDFNLDPVFDLHLGVVSGVQVVVPARKQRHGGRQASPLEHLDTQTQAGTKRSRPMGQRSLEAEER